MGALVVQVKAGQAATGRGRPKAVLLLTQAASFASA